jgi:hypothetical protein
MTAAVWAIGISALLALGLTYLIGEARGHIRGYGNGYAARQRDERRTMTRAIKEVRQQGLAAERDVDYLYERARRRIDDPS